MLSKTKTPRLLTAAFALTLLVTGGAIADDRPASPRTTASTQIGDAWIDVHYGAPILRGRRDIFGAGEEYGKTVNAGAPVWRAGANVTTRLNTGLDLEISGTRVPAGEYSFFIELGEGAWTAVLSSQPFMESYSREKIGEGITWGAYGYKPDHDVVRVALELSEPGMSVDQLAYFFDNVSDEGGELGLIWDNQMALMPFKVAE